MRLGREAKCDIDYAPTGIVWRFSCATDGVLDYHGDRDQKRVSTSVAAIPISGRKRILIVEDEVMLAIDLASILEEAGFEAIGPARSVKQALMLIDGVGCEAAVVDVNLGSETAEEIAERLVKRGTPFVTISGYGHEQLPTAFKHAPLISKPIQPQRLVDELGRWLSHSAIDRDGTLQPASMSDLESD